LNHTINDSEPKRRIFNMFYTVFLAIFWFCSLILAAVAIPIGTVERNWRISYAGIYQFVCVFFSSPA